MPVSGEQAIGAGPVEGGVDLFAATTFTAAPIAGAGAVTVTKEIAETGYYQIWGGVTITVTAAPRRATFFVSRGITARELDVGAVDDVSAPAYRFPTHEGWLAQFDEVKVADLGGALGDAGEVYVCTRRLGR